MNDGDMILNLNSAANNMPPPLEITDDTETPDTEPIVENSVSADSINDLPETENREKNEFSNSTNGDATL
jgi:hypothetical protein